MKRISLSLLALILCAFGAKAQTTVADSLGPGIGVWTNPAKMLQGRVSGVTVSTTDGNPAGMVSTHIRGLNSVRGVSEPLWVVDGAVLTSSAGQTFQPFNQYGDFAFVSELSQMEIWDIFDIESIQVLKNTAETAKYGTRGADGVILIKTRRPDSDDFVKKFNTNVGVSFPGVSGEGLQPAIAHNHSLSLASASGRSRYRFTAFYKNTNGVVERSNSNAAGIRIMFDTKANQVVWFGLNSSFSLANASSRSAAAWYGAPSYMLELRGISPLSYNDPEHVSSLAGWGKDYDDDSRVFRTTDDFYLTFNFTPTLRWHNTVSFDMQDNSRLIWYGNGTTFGKSYNGAAGISYASLLTLDMKSELSWGRWFGNHNIKLLAAAEYSSDWNKFNVMSGTNFFMHDMRARGLNLNESKTVIRYFPKDLGAFGWQGGLSYCFAKVAGVDFSGRYESVERYDSGRSFGDNFYPAASLWLDLRALLFPTVQSVSSLRLEGGYGIAGRRRYVPYEMLPVFTGGGYPDVDVDYQGFYEGYDRIRSGEWNVFLKGTILGGRLDVSLGYYNKTTDDVLSLYCFGEQHPTKPTVWRESERKEVLNQGSTISNKGFEADIALHGGRALKWNISLNLAYNINRLENVDPGDARGYLLNQYGMYATKNVEGNSVSSIYGFVLNADNTVVGEGVLGETVPKFTGGLGFTANYKGASFAFDAYAAIGHMLLNLNRMLASGEEYVAGAFVEKGDYLKVGRVSFGYDIPVNMKYINAINVNISATNLLTLTSYKGWNPEVNSFSATNLANGLDYGSYPLARLIMLGACVKF